MFLFIAVNVLNLLDVASTKIGIHYGLKEKNPLALWAFRRIGFWKCMVLKVAIIFTMSVFLYANLPITEISFAIIFSVLLLAVISNLLWTLAKGVRPIKELPLS